MKKSSLKNIISILFVGLLLTAAIPISGLCTAPSGFGPGEKLEYDVDWGLINAGSTELSIRDTVRVDGHLCYRMISRTTSNAFVTAFFKVDDRVKSMMDVEGLYSRGFQKHLREGDYREDRWFKINQELGQVFQLDTTAATKYSADTVYVDFGVQDVLSALQYVRFQDLVPGSEIRLQTVDNLKPYELVVKVHRRQRIKVPAGRFDCLVVEPLLKSTGLFKSKGKLTIWMTDDERRLPI